MYSDKVHAAIVECLVYSQESPYPPIPAAAFVRHLRESLAWGKAEVDVVEAVSMRILRTQLDREIATMTEDSQRVRASRSVVQGNAARYCLRGARRPPRESMEVPAGSFIRR